MILCLNLKGHALVEFLPLEADGSAVQVEVVDESSPPRHMPVCIQELASFETDLYALCNIFSPLFARVDGSLFNFIAILLI